MIENLGGVVINKKKGFKVAIRAIQKGADFIKCAN